MNDPLELLENKNNRIPSFLSDKYNPVGCGLLGVGAATFINWALRRPLLSGVQKHIILGVGGVLLGSWLEEKRVAHFAEKDAVLRHYVQLHPDDFPVKPRVKFADVLESWTPIR
uniref:NADH dehydrogenase [ubiquinone] 1 subunit C2 n=1 Tax=Megaselia scalaris TaxID=36166 RepID=T1GTF6_MEGSC